MVEQVASIAEILADPELEPVIHARSIITVLDSLATLQFCNILPNLAIQSFVQHKQFGYLIPPLSELQSRISDYVVKFKLLKMKRTSLEYPCCLFLLHSFSFLRLAFDLILDILI